ncbi:hypothetical protein ACHAQH_000916 [Verticillium albo-atrum]
MPVSILSHRAESSLWDAEKEDTIRRPYRYSTSHPGKDMRSQLLNAFNAWLLIPESHLNIIKKAISTLHEASLLIDDIQDASELRRGHPAAHTIFGVPETINAANYMYFVALQEIQSLGNAEATRAFCEELLSLHRGQGMDLFWRESRKCPSEAEYFEMVSNKTAGLFRLSVKLMQAVSDRCSVDCVPLASLLGVVFQIRDDYVNLMSAEYRSAKGTCEDITEGKFSFPVIHSIRSTPNDDQLLRILNQKTSNSALKQQAIHCMEHTGSFDYTRNVLSSLSVQAKAMVASMEQGRGEGQGILFIMDKLSIE